MHVRIEIDKEHAPVQSEGQNIASCASPSETKRSLTLCVPGGEVIMRLPEDKKVLFG